MKKVLYTLAVSSLVALSNAVGSKPNVLILYADDMGYGDLGIQNPASKISTPHLDTLARQGMRFTDGHASSAICTPSRYALLTGRYHWRDFHNIVGAFGASVFKPEQLTLPEMLQESGYYTAAIGKWHLGWDWEALRKPSAGKGRPLKNGNRLVRFDEYDWNQSIPDGPLAHGFDHYFGDSVINFPPYVWIQDDKVVEAPNTMMSTKGWKPLKEGAWECRPGPMVQGWDPYEVLPEMTRFAVSFLESRQDAEQPFFLYFALPSPHAPIVPTEEFEGASNAGPYGDFVVQTDWSCGQLLAALERAGLSDNTIVIFTADNGAEHYAYPRALKYDHWSSEPFRGAKRDIYEGGHHVPFVVRWPEVIQPGSVSDALVSQVDIMATLGAVIGRELPSGQAADSKSFLPVLKGETEHARHALVHNTWKNAYAMRQGDWVLINAKTGDHNGKHRSAAFEKKRGYVPDDNFPVELYHLKEDPSQASNVAKEYPEKVKSLQALLKDIQNQT